MRRGAVASRASPRLPAKARPPRPDGLGSASASAPSPSLRHRDRHRGGLRKRRTDIMSARNNAPRRNIRAEITNQLIAAIEMEPSHRHQPLRCLSHEPCFRAGKAVPCLAADDMSQDQSFDMGGSPICKGGLPRRDQTPSGGSGNEKNRVATCPAWGRCDAVFTALLRERELELSVLRPGSWSGFSQSLG